MSQYDVGTHSQPHNLHVSILTSHSEPKWTSSYSKYCAVAVKTITFRTVLCLWCFLDSYCMIGVTDTEIICNEQKCVLFSEYRQCFKTSFFGISKISNSAIVIGICWCWQDIWCLRYIHDTIITDSLDMTCRIVRRWWCVSYVFPKFLLICVKGCTRNSVPKFREVDPDFEIFIYRGFQRHAEKKPHGSLNDHCRKGIGSVPWMTITGQRNSAGLWVSNELKFDSQP